MQLAQDGAEDGQAREDGGWDEGVAADADVEGAWLAFIINNKSEPYRNPRVFCLCRVGEG